jgi:hypothetical protein
VTDNKNWAVDGTINLTILNSVNEDKHVGYLNFFFGLVDALEAHLNRENVTAPQTREETFFRCGIGGARLCDVRSNGALARDFLLVLEAESVSRHTLGKHGWREYAKQS